MRWSGRSIFPAWLDSEWGSVYQRGRIWWIGYWRNGEPLYESSNSERKKKLCGCSNSGKEGSSPGRSPVLLPMFACVTCSNQSSKNTGKMSTVR